MLEGKIIKGIAGFYYVKVQGNVVYECRARGIFRKNNIVPLIGDMVKIDVLDDKNHKGSVVEILSRKNQLTRPTVSNIDQAIIVFALTSPEPSKNLLDRFLILAEEQDVEVIICFNKVDMITNYKENNIVKIYKEAGYEVILTSTLTGAGINELASKLENKTTVFAGPSGVGKSSLLNALNSNLKLLTGEISEKIQRGKHTTRHVELLTIENDGYVVDTPGFSSLYLEHIRSSELSWYFKEFELYSGMCRFKGCSHIHEPNCFVKQALAEGKIAKERYKNYILIYNELKDTEDRHKWRR